MATLFVLTVCVCSTCRYLSLTEGTESYAVIRDSGKVVVSLPPVTNSERSKVSGLRAVWVLCGVHLQRISIGMLRMQELFFFWGGGTLWF